MELIYIGKKFYKESNKVMSDVYDAQGIARDFNYMAQALEKGEYVTIRPATQDEIDYYQGILDEFKKIRGWSKAA